MSFKRCAAHWRRDTDTEVVCLDGVWFRRRGLVAEFRAGPESGPAGMAAADRAALAAGFALMNADGPVLPWPNPDAT